MAHTQAQVAVGYFENSVAGKITEPWVAGFRATFIIYRGCPKCTGAGHIIRISSKS